MMRIEGTPLPFIKGLLPRSRAPKTLTAILNTLGDFSRAQPMCQFPERFIGQAVGARYVEFPLSEEGETFFREGTGMAKVDEKAHLFLMPPADRQECESYVPYCIFFRAEPTPYPGRAWDKTGYAFNLTPFLSGVLPDNFVPDNSFYYLMQAKGFLMEDVGLHWFDLKLKINPLSWNDFMEGPRGLDGELKALTIGDDDSCIGEFSNVPGVWQLFSYRNQFSADFQQVLCLHDDRRRCFDRKIVEIGTGSGINIVTCSQAGG